MSRVALVLAGILALWSQAAQAEEPYYFHRAGTTREAYAEDVIHCAELAGGARIARYTAQPLNYNAPYAVESAAIASLFLGFLQARERRRLMSRVERTCMADKGYRRRTVDKAVNREIRALKDDARLDRLYALVSAEVPTGEVMVE
jgi:hypothetical protein